MKLGMALLVRNEMDIIKFHIEYHKPKVDCILVMDNGSTDGTYEYLKSLECKNFHVVSEPSHNYLQDKWMTSLICNLKVMGMDWVVASDADEFWRGDLRAEIGHASKSDTDCIFTNSYVFCSTARDDHRIGNPALRQFYREPNYEKYPKVIVNTKNFISIGKGNDDAFFDSKTRSVSISNSMIYHYSQRGFNHYTKKYLEGGKAIEESMKAGETWNSQWSMPYSIFKDMGMDAFVAMWYEKYYIRDVSQLVEDRTMEDDYV